MRTVGEILQEKRLKLGLSLEEVEKKTKIRKSILHSLEKGNWDALPAPTFIKGFISNYGEFLDLNVAELLAFFRREYDEKKNPKITSPVGINRPRFVINTTTIVVGFITVAVLVVSIYLFIQYQSFTGSPQLSLSEPKDNLRTSSVEVLVVGRTYSDATLKINGQDVQLSPGGAFSVAVALVEGVNELVVTASNRFGKTSTQKRNIIVEIPTVVTANNQATASSALKEDLPLKLVVKIEPQSSWIHIETDGNLSFEGVLVSGSVKNFEAKESIKIITGNAGSAKVTFNNGNEEILGSGGQRVEKEFKK